MFLILLTIFTFSKTMVSISQNINAIGPTSRLPPLRSWLQKQSVSVLPTMCITNKSKCNFINIKSIVFFKSCFYIFPSKFSYTIGQSWQHWLTAARKCQALRSLLWAPNPDFLGVYLAAAAIHAPFFWLTIKSFV